MAVDLEMVVVDFNLVGVALECDLSPVDLEMADVALVAPLPEALVALEAPLDVDGLEVVEAGLDDLGMSGVVLEEVAVGLDMSAAE